jgi:hypothetical protein
MNKASSERCVSKSTHRRQDFQDFQKHRKRGDRKQQFDIFALQSEREDPHCRSKKMKRLHNQTET